MSTVLILMGPPGAGKGTQAARLAADLSVPHVSTGDLFRENLGRGTPLGVQAQTFMSAGKLVPDDVVLDMLFDRVARPDCAKGYVLDGFPRTLPQAEALDRKLPRGTKLRVFLLEVPDENIVERLGGRLTCKACGTIHALRESPPRVAGKCDRCGGELIQRPDDQPEVVQKRLAVYRAQTQPVERYYRERGVLTKLDADGTRDEVYRKLSQRARGEEAA